MKRIFSLGIPNASVISCSARNGASLATQIVRRPRFFIKLRVGRVRLHGGVLDHRHEISFFDTRSDSLKPCATSPVRSLKCSATLACAPGTMKSALRYLSKVFMNCDRAGFTGFLRIGVDRQIFVFDFDQFYCGLRGIFVFRRDRGDGFTDITHFALSKKGFILDDFAVCPGASSPVTTATTPGSSWPSRYGSS